MLILYDLMGLPVYRTQSLSINKFPYILMVHDENAEVTVKKNNVQHKYITNI